MEALQDRDFTINNTICQASSVTLSYHIPSVSFADQGSFTCFADTTDESIISHERTVNVYGNSA